MTEKDYSGTVTGKIGKNAKTSSSSGKENLMINKKQDKREKTESSGNMNLEDYKRAGEIAKKVKEYAKTIIKKDTPLAEIAEKIEARILELKGEVAFPVNLGIDDVAAHFTPTLKDEIKATGLLKVDFGVHVNGFIADIAFSLDLTPEKKYSKLIEASELALKAALEQVKEKKENTSLSEIGKAIQKTIESQGFIPIANLSGHGLDEYDIHSGINIPNYDSGSNKELGEGAFATEPFATLKIGSGMVYDGNGGNIYHITGKGQVRDNFAREVLEFILETKITLPFSQREMERKFGSKAIFAMAYLKRAGAIEEFPQLIEKSHQPISQAETSFVIHNGVVDILVDN